MAALEITRNRLGRLAEDRQRFTQNIEDVFKAAEDESRELTDDEQAYVEKHRSKVKDIDVEIDELADDVERAEGSRDISRLLRPAQAAPAVPGQPADAPVYRTFAEFARDEIIVRYPLIATQAAGGAARAEMLRAQARERLERAVLHTLSGDIPGLLPPQHMSQIMDIINGSRPVVSSARQVDLSSGTLTYPRITQRPNVIKQTTEKTEGGTLDMQVALDTVTADTYIGGGNLSWQAINWSTPGALQLWFDLAAEAYARATETAACSELGTTSNGTSSPSLGTAGTEDFAGWQAAVMAGIASIYSTTGGRANTNTLWLSPTKFFQLAKLGTASTLQVSAVGGLNVDSMTGTWMGLRVVGSYGWTGNMAIVGDASAFLVGETPGAPVEMRAVEPTIGGMEVGVIGAFKSKVFDSTRFIHVAVSS